MVMLSHTNMLDAGSLTGKIEVLHFPPNIIGIATTTTICKSNCSMSVGHAGHSINREV